LGKNWAYKRFRKERTLTNNPHILVDYLGSYSEKKEEYTKLLKSMIKYNKFDKYDINSIIEIDINTTKIAVKDKNTTIKIDQNETTATDINTTAIVAVDLNKIKKIAVDINRTIETDQNKTKAFDINNTINTDVNGTAQ